MSIADYTPILIQLLVVLFIAVAILLASHLLGQRSKPGKIKDAAYECGLISVGNPHPRLAVKFYVTAMLFIIFDIEIVFMVPWTLIHREFIQNNLQILFPISVFLFLLALGIVYELKKGGVEWDK